MRLVAVYFPGQSDTGLPYHKAMVYVEDKQYFLNMGAVEEQPEAVEEGFISPDEVEAEAEEVPNPDKGFGVPGSYEWHCNQIGPMRKKIEVINYVSEVIGEDANQTIARNKTLTVIKLRAKKLIKGFLENDD